MPPLRREVLSCRGFKQAALGEEPTRQEIKFRGAGEGLSTEDYVQTCCPDKSGRAHRARSVSLSCWSYRSGPLFLGRPSHHMGHSLQ